MFVVANRNRTELRRSGISSTRCRSYGACECGRWQFYKDSAPTALPQRDGIAFPKTAKGTDLKTDSPATVEPKQLRDLHNELKVKEPMPPRTF